MYQLILAIKKCHKHNIIHVDIKLENIGLLYKNDLYHLKLLDFGGSKKIDLQSKNQINLYLSDFEVSPHYIPPEILNNVTILQKDLVYLDFWELGVIMYILMYGIYPYYGKSDNAIFKNITKGKRYKKIKEPQFREYAKHQEYENYQECNELIECLLNLDYKKRLNLDVLKTDFSEDNIFTRVFDEIKEDIPKILH